MLTYHETSHHISPFQEARRSREDSFQMLQEKLKESAVSLEELLRIHQAISVLYSRHVLASVLCHWPRPPHPCVSTSLLGSLDMMQLFCLLDLLVKPLTQHARNDVSPTLPHILDIHVHVYTCTCCTIPDVHVRTCIHIRTCIYLLPHVLHVPTIPLNCIQELGSVCNNHRVFIDQVFCHFSAFFSLIIMLYI